MVRDTICERGERDPESNCTKFCQKQFEFVAFLEGAGLGGVQAFQVSGQGCVCQCSKHHP